MRISALTSLLLIAGCGVSNQNSGLRDISEVQSMWQRADGTFDVLCRDNSREIATASMVQKNLVCNGAAQLTEYFQLGATQAIDLLIVIDNSSSMEEYQALMTSALTPLLSNIKDLDWQIGIVTTDSACLRGGRTMTRADYLANLSEVETRFRTAITPGGGGSTTERGILYATQGLQGNCGNPAQKWVRPNSQVAALVISDEPNCGGAVNEGCPGQVGEKAEYFTQNVPSGTKFFGLLFDQSNPLCPYRDTPPPTEYWRLVDMTNGLWGDICSSSYEAFLNRVSSSIAGNAGTQIQLSQNPKVDQLLIYLDGVELKAEEYVLSGRSVRILKSGSGNAKVTIVYKRAN